MGVAAEGTTFTSFVTLFCIYLCVCSLFTDVFLFSDNPPGLYFHTRARLSLKRKQKVCIQVNVCVDTRVCHNTEETSCT